MSESPPPIRFASILRGADPSRDSFLNERLKGALAYDRIAGFFSASILETRGNSRDGRWPHPGCLQFRTQPTRCCHGPRRGYSTPAGMVRLSP